MRSNCTAQGTPATFEASNPCRVAIESFVGSMNQAEFTGDRKTVYAVTRALEMISEASRRLPKEDEGPASLDRLGGSCRSGQCVPA